jgi:hypothetical protein
MSVPPPTADRRDMSGLGQKATFILRLVLRPNRTFLAFRARRAGVAAQDSRFAKSDSILLYGHTQGPGPGFSGPDIGLNRLIFGLRADFGP